MTGGGAGTVIGGQGGNAIVGTGCAHGVRQGPGQQGHSGGCTLISIDGCSGTHGPGCVFGQPAPGGQGPPHGIHGNGPHGPFIGPQPGGILK